MNVKISLWLLAALTLMGCQSTTSYRAPSPSTLTAVGFASISLQSGATFEQKTLQAIMASKLAAYRELTEQVYGQEINGSTSVSQMLVNNDSLQGSVHGVIRGAEVVATYPKGDTYVTELKMDMDKVLRLTQQLNAIQATQAPVIKVPSRY